MQDQYHYDYETDSYYCYPGTYILKNKLNITDENELKDAERSITSLRTAQLMQNPLDGDLDFNFLDFSKISNEEMLEASVQTFSMNYDLMSSLILKSLTKNE